MPRLTIASLNARLADYCLTVERIGSRYAINAGSEYLTAPEFRTLADVVAHFEALAGASEELPEPAYYDPEEHVRHNQTLEQTSIYDEANNVFQPVFNDRNMQLLFEFGLLQVASDTNFVHPLNQCSFSPDGLASLVTHGYSDTGYHALCCDITQTSTYINRNNPNGWNGWRQNVIANPEGWQVVEPVEVVRDTPPFDGWLYEEGDIWDTYGDMGDGGSLTTVSNTPSIPENITRNVVVAGSMLLVMITSLMQVLLEETNRALVDKSQGFAEVIARELTLSTRLAMEYAGCVVMCSLAFGKGLISPLLS